MVLRTGERGEKRPFSLLKYTTFTTTFNVVKRAFPYFSVLYR